MRWMSHAVAWGVVLLGLGAHVAAAAQEFGGTLRMSDGASLSAQKDEAFHDIGRKGLTVEGWFYLDERPEAGEVQTLFANRSKYAVGVGATRAFGSIWSDQRWGMTSTSVMGSRDNRDTPVGEWFHVAWQFHTKPPDVAWLYAHEHTTSFDGVAIFPWTLAAGDGALYIATPEIGQRGFRLGPGTDITIFRGLVDEVRVSSIARYTRRGAARPRHFRPDRHTVALWTFDGAHPYADSSGNGHHLMHTGTIRVEPLAVDARDRLTTTWAQLRSVGH